MARIVLPIFGRNRKRGFTLIELMVALTMGLIVGVAVVGLSREVTSTFHEEARVTAAESGLRMAMDRLRADVSRASMMSTANASADPTAKLNVLAAATTAYVTGLAGIRIYDQGSTTTAAAGKFLGVAPGASAPATIPAVNGLAPDAIDITGNFAPGGDYYSVQSINMGGSSCGAGDRLRLSLTDAIYRLAPSDATAAVGSAEFQNTLLRTFIPSGAGGATSLFLARVVDRNSAVTPVPSQFVIVCNAGWNAADGPFVDTLSSTLDAVKTTTSGTSLQNLGEQMMINPVQTVRWRIVQSPTAGVFAEAGLNPLHDSLKFDLLRTFVDVTGAEVGSGNNPIGEVVAEYMVDLKFRLTVDTEPVATQPPVPNLATFPFDDGGTNWAAPITQLKPVTTITAAAPGTPSPQRIRSIGIRLSARTSLPDRTADLPSPTGAPYLYRYGMDGGGVGNGFARVRTLMSEVALVNQQTATYP